MLWSSGGQAPTKFFASAIHIEPQLTKLRDQVSRPAVNVVFFNDSPHAAHAQLLFLRLHLQRSPDGFGSLVDVVRIHQKGVAEFARSSRELAQNQYAAFVVARRQKFLGNQIHAIVQGGYHAKIRCPEVAVDLFVVMLPLQEYDGFPLAVLKAPVDALRFGFDFREKIVITLDVGTAGRPDLHEGKFVLELGILFQKALNGLETLGDSLCIVHAVNAHADDGRIDADAVHQEIG